MKTFKFFAVAALLAISTGAFAQFTNSKSSAGSSSSSEKKNSVYFQYNPSEFSGDGLDESFNAVALGYSKTFGFAEEALFLEVGGALQYSFYSKSGLKINFFSVKIPINFGYNWQVTDKVAIAPYVGLTARGNVYGRYEAGGHSDNLFSGDGAWKRFQIGWQVGTNVKFLDKFYVGCSYGTDFNKIADGIKVKTTSITAGLMF